MFRPLQDNDEGYGFSSLVMVVLRDVLRLKGSFSMSMMLQKKLHLRMKFKIKTASSLVAFHG